MKRITLEKSPLVRFQDMNYKIIIPEDIRIRALSSCAAHASQSLTLKPEYSHIEIRQYASDIVAIETVTIFHVKQGLS